VGKHSKLETSAVGAAYSDSIATRLLVRLVLGAMTIALWTAQMLTMVAEGIIWKSSTMILDNLLSKTGGQKPGQAGHFPS
jgi:hypothetical protein